MPGLECDRTHTGTSEMRSGGELEYIALNVSERVFPNAMDIWDANWLNCTVEIAAGAFLGRVQGMIRTEELETFRGQLLRLYDGLNGGLNSQRWRNGCRYGLSATDAAILKLDAGLMMNRGSEIR